MSRGFNSCGMPMLKRKPGEHREPCFTLNEIAEALNIERPKVQAMVAKFGIKFALGDLHKAKNRKLYHLSDFQRALNGGEPMFAVSKSVPIPTTYKGKHKSPDRVKFEDLLRAMQEGDSVVVPITYRAYQSNVARDLDLVLVTRRDASNPDQMRVWLKARK